MPTRLKIDLAAGLVEAAGADDFVRAVYQDFKERLSELAIRPGAGQTGVHDLLDEARIALAWREFARARNLYEVAREQCPPDAGDEVVAEILECSTSAEMRLSRKDR